MPHINEVPWDKAIRTELEDPIYQAMPDDAARAEAMNAKTVKISRPFTFGDVRQITLQEEDWPNLVQRARKETEEREVKAAISATTVDAKQVIDLSDPKAAASFAEGIAALGASSDLSPASVAAINALGTVDIPWWQSIGAPAPLNDSDIARANFKPGDPSDVKLVLAEQERVAAANAKMGA